MNAIPAVQARSSLPRSLIIGLAMLIPLLIYFTTAQSIVAIWNRSETFAHGYVILPISLWLIWQRRAELRQMEVAPFWPAFVLLALCGFGWLLAQLGDVQIVKQYAFTAMLPLAALAMLGQRIARTIVFALLFVLFAVPFGEIFIGPLMDVTANLTIHALRATGIPVLREGNSFSIPSGDWSVVEACSGLRYLIASITLGTLYAYLTYRSRKRQVLFVLLSILVPIVANSGRAYMIVMMGHLSGMTMAVGVDHLVYGWVFFGIVMFLLFWIGSFWREDHVQATPAPAPAPAQVQPARSSTGALVAATLAVAVCIGIWPAYAYYLERGEANLAPPRIGTLDLAWQPGTPFAAWTPGFAPPAAQSQQFYENDGRKAGLSLLYYRNQRPGALLITSSNRVVAEKSEWRTIDATVRTESFGARSLGLREEIVADARGKMLVWQWYWIGGDTTRSDYVGKAFQVRQKLLHGSDDGVAVLAFARYDEKPEEARATLRAFLAANLVPIEATLAATTRH
jgi:exosortase A